MWRRPTVEDLTMGVDFSTPRKPDPPDEPALSYGPDFAGHFAMNRIQQLPLTPAQLRRAKGLAPDLQAALVEAFQGPVAEPDHPHWEPPIDVDELRRIFRRRRGR